MLQALLPSAPVGFASQQLFANAYLQSNDLGQTHQHTNWRFLPPSVPTTKHSAVPLPQAVPLLGLDTPAAGPRARRPLGPLAPPVGGHIRTLLQAVGGL